MTEQTSYYKKKAFLNFLFLYSIPDHYLFCMASEYDTKNCHNIFLLIKRCVNKNENITQCGIWFLIEWCFSLSFLTFSKKFKLSKKVIRFPKTYSMNLHVLIFNTVQFHVLRHYWTPKNCFFIIYIFILSWSNDYIYSFSLDNKLINDVTVFIVLFYAN